MTHPISVTSTFGVSWTTWVVSPSNLSCTGHLFFFSAFCWIILPFASDLITWERMECHPHCRMCVSRCPFQDLAQSCTNHPTLRLGFFFCNQHGTNALVMPASHIVISMAGYLQGQLYTSSWDIFLMFKFIFMVNTAFPTWLSERSPHPRWVHFVLGQWLAHCSFTHSTLYSFSGSTLWPVPWDVCLYTMCPVFLIDALPFSLPLLEYSMK